MFLFFFRHKPAYVMRISYWSSDVCSSDLTIGPCLASAVQSVLGDRAPSYILVVWHGFTMPLLMSVIALVGGTTLYMLFRDRLNAVEQSPLIWRLKGRRTFEPPLAVIVDAARALHRLLGTGRLQVQLRLPVATALLAVFLPPLRPGSSPGPLPAPPLDTV